MLSIPNVSFTPLGVQDHYPSMNSRPEPKVNEEAPKKMGRLTPQQIRAKVAAHNESKLDEAAKAAEAAEAEAAPAEE